MKQIPYVLILCFISCALAQRESCKTPNGETAKCVSIYSCPKLYESGKSGRPDAYRFLQQSVCRKSYYNLYVCCGSDTTFKEQKPTAPTMASRHNLIADKSECGYMNADFKIYGGNRTGLGEFPWMALLEYKNLTSGERKFLCGGSLIGKRHIMTAAHCVTGKSLDGFRLVNIRLGEWNVSSSKDCVRIGRKMECSDPVMNVGFERLTPHVDFVDSVKNDIALIRLDRDIKYSKFVSPICLPADEKQQPNTKMFVAGWGKTERGTNSEVLLKVQVPIVNNELCDWLLGKRIKVRDTQICAGGEKWKDSCRGDSGGPLMHRDVETDQWSAEGIVSLGKGCGSEGYPAVYTKVRSFNSWIRMHAF
ncbi:PREDICTED: serine protease easter-like [Nicrophorus vespilloides]|uniref:CLIP domain-containing serine protease n=1 Tax=Nicrophorus vespilloides TaxID=110193 RepID=A0ABM1MZS8_NICVS|nr:PREDICTED: serine protease easter-like [Nicrophorus vespilloides]